MARPSRCSSLPQAVKRDGTLSESAISVREIPAAYVDSRAVRATEKKKITGVRVVNALQPGQTLTWTDVAAAGERRILSSLVQPGFRAFNLKTRADSTTFDLIEPGDHVDLISTVTGAGGRANVEPAPAERARPRGRLEHR